MKLWKGYHHVARQAARERRRLRVDHWEWQSWFAWHPIEDRYHQWRWLETVERQWSPYISRWRYRPLPVLLGGEGND